MDKSIAKNNGRLMLQFYANIWFMDHYKVIVNFLGCLSDKKTTID